MRHHKVNFHFIEDPPWLNGSTLVREWLLAVSKAEKKVIEQIDYLFCSDDYLIELNKRHLHHNTYTDILTFPYSYDPIVAEIYISLDRVAENALIHAGSDRKNELYRVILHGFLHMCGYMDKTDEEKTLMQAKEDHYLGKVKNWHLR